MRSNAVLPRLCFTLLIAVWRFCSLAAPVAAQQPCGPGGVCPAGFVCNPVTDLCVEIGAPTPTGTSTQTQTATATATATTTPHTVPAASADGLVGLGVALAGVAWLAFRRTRRRN